MVNLCFSQKKTSTQRKITKKERMSWILHNFALHLLHFRAKFACPCISKLMFRIRLWVHRFLVTCNCQNPIAWFIGLNVLCFFHRTQRPLLYDCKDYNVFCFHACKDYNVFCFHAFKDYNVFSLLHLQEFNVFRLLHFQRFQCLLSFTLSKTTMSFVLWFQDYNVFCFMISKTSMS